MTEAKKHGGSRPGAGRPPIADPTKTVSIQVKTSCIDTLTRETCQSIALQAIEKAYKKTLKEKK